MYDATARFCKKNSNIIFTRSDKGNVTVAMDRTIYNNKVTELLNDTNTYSIIKTNPASKIERNLNDFLKIWLKKRVYHKERILLHAFK